MAMRPSFLAFSSCWEICERAVVFERANNAVPSVLLLAEFEKFEVRFSIRVGVNYCAIVLTGNSFSTVEPV